MNKLVFIFAIMLGATSCNSGSKVETVDADTTEVVDTIEVVDSIPVDSIVD